MNPIRFIKAFFAAKKLADKVEETRMSKHLLKSRTFWVNALTAAVELSGALSGFLPSGTLVLITNVLNIALRLVTDTAVHIATPEGDG
jgi:hypothetical protein